ncbi:TetR family transcriptional regulator [Streptomyces sp. NPDC050145]|uniref:TetR family transcriptional regulator n=1 Tax=Streptomyces sp. NPDC050145 TaxID=3365602 RepID=UPI0037AA0BA2
MATKRRGIPAAGKAVQILESFTRRVAESGYDGTNFGDIAEELGISKGTIVHHYGTKDRLLAVLHESYMQRRLAEARRILERLSTPADQLAGLLYAFVRYQVHDRHATVAFQRESVRLAGQEMHAEGDRLRDEYLELVRGVMRDGATSGMFRRTDVAMQSLLLFGSAQWAWTWFDPEGEKDVDEIGSAFVDLVLGSLLARRTALARLSDPAGEVAETVRACLVEAAATP